MERPTGTKEHAAARANASGRRAVIIGGGIGGLAAGIALRNAGFDVEVFERAQEPKEVGAGLSLWANALRALEHLGLQDALRARALPSLTGGIYDRSGRVITSMTHPALAERFGDYNVMIHRADLLEMLLEALGEERVRFGRTLVGVEQDERSVRVWFGDGSETRADVVIGADGLRSAVRAQLFGAQPPVYAGYTAWRGVTEFDHERLLPGESWGSGARFGRVPMKGGRAYWFATRNAPEGEAPRPGATKNELLATFGGWHAPIRELIEATDETAILRNDIYDRPPLRSWSKGRVTLLGDAAHPMTPNLGQGACQALEDAVVLARCLRDHEDVAVAFAAYEAARRGRTSAIVLQSRRIGAVGQWSHPLAVRARDALFRALPPSLQARQLEDVLRFDA